MKKLYLLAVLLFSLTAANAATYYWVGGTGSWTDSTQTVGYLLAGAYAGNTINVHSNSSGTQAIIALGNDACLDYLDVTDMQATGANFYAGSNSTNGGNNTRILFADCSPRMAAQYSSTVEIMPNPALHSSTLYYTMQNAGEVQIRIYDVTGKCVFSEDHTEQADGRYFLPLRLEDLPAFTIAP